VHMVMNLSSMEFTSVNVIRTVVQFRSFFVPSFLSQSLLILWKNTRVTAVHFIAFRMGAL
jgi:hypothetical protein